MTAAELLERLRKVTVWKRGGVIWKKRARRFYHVVMP
jgi:hypothetical protein